MTKVFNKKSLSLLLVLSMVIALFAGMSFGASAAYSGNWSSYYDATWYSSSATELTIYDAADLAAFAYKVNNGTNFSGVTITLNNDIDLDGHYWDPIGNGNITSDSTTYSPKPGSNPKGFAGTFEGNGKRIYNMSVNLNRSGTGLFGYVTATGVVQNFSLTDSTVAGTSGKDAVGGVVGYNDGTIYNVTSSAVVSASGVYNVGGIAGFNNNYYGTNHRGVISTCEVTGNVTGGTKVGGIAGENAGVVSQCSVNGATIKGSNTSSKNGVGGIVGRNGNNNTAYETGYVVNCYVNGVTVGSSGQSWVGGIAGFNDSLSYVSTCYVNASTINGGSWRNTIVGKQEGTSQYNYVGSGSYTNSGNSTGEIGTVATPSNMLSYLNEHARDLTPNDDSEDDIWEIDANSTYTYPVLTKIGDYFLTNAVAANDPNNYATNNHLQKVILSSSGASTLTLTGSETTATVNNPYTAAKYAAYSSNSNCYVSVSSTFTVNGTVSPIYDNVTFLWEGASGGTMFTISSGTLTIAGPTIDGNTTNSCNTLFDLNGGTLKIRGGSETKNCTYAVKVAAGTTFQLSRATIGGTVKLENATNDAYITIANVLDSDVYIVCDNASVYSIVASGAPAYITSTTVNHIKYTGHTFNIDSSGSVYYVYIAS